MGHHVADDLRPKQAISRHQGAEKSDRRTKLGTSSLRAFTKAQTALFLKLFRRMSLKLIIDFQFSVLVVWLLLKKLFLLVAVSFGDDEKTSFPEKVTKKNVCVLELKIGGNVQTAIQI